MTRLPMAAARDAWRRWRADRETILAVAGPFLFLPMLAWLLLVPEPVAPPGATREQAAAILVQWGTEHLPWLALRIGFELFATVALLSLYLARNHRTVAALLSGAIRTLPSFAVAVLMSWGLVTLGMLPGLTIAGAGGGALIALLPLFALPACYIYGRVALTGPVLVAEPGVGVTGAIGRSVALTHGNGWRVFALLAMPLFAGFVALQVIGSIEDALQAGGAANPVAKVIVDGLAGVIATVSGLTRILFQVSLYRRLATPRHVI